MILFIFFYFTSFRKPIVPQKEPSPLLEKKIQLLEAKFAELEGGDDDIEEMGEEDSEVIEPPSLPQLQTPLASELDLMPYTPPQVTVTGSCYLSYSQLWFIAHSSQGKETSSPHIYELQPGILQKGKDFFFLDATKNFKFHVFLKRI